MFHISIIGQTRVGKSSLCAQWRGHPPLTSYSTTFCVDKYTHDNVIFFDFPSLPRFQTGLLRYYLETDVFVLVVNRGPYTIPDIYEEIRQYNTTASWLLILNNVCPKQYKWASDRQIGMVHVNIRTGSGVYEAYQTLIELTRNHTSRSQTLSLVYEVYNIIFQLLCQVFQKS